MICAARSIVSSGETTRTSPVMHWFTFMVSLLAGARLKQLGPAASAVGPADLVLVRLPVRPGVVLDVSLDGVVALGKLEVAAHRVGALRLPDAGVASQIAVEVGSRFDLVGHDAFLSAFRAALFVGAVGLRDRAFGALRAAAPLLCVACRGTALVGLLLLAAAARRLG